MRTLDEVIKEMTDCIEQDLDCSECESFVSCAGRPWRAFDNDVLHYLQEYRAAQQNLTDETQRTHAEHESYQEAVKNCELAENRYKREEQVFKRMQEDYLRELNGDNEALTWEQLKIMEGKPVWIEYNLHLSERAQALSKAWFVILDFRPLGKNEMMITKNNFVFTDYEIGTEWKAYRKERADG